MRRPTQRERVLTLLCRYGPRGITQVDLHSPTIDGGDPIIRLPSRIDELRRAGHRIETRGRKNRCAVYVLVGAPDTPTPGPRGATPDEAATPQLGVDVAPDAPRPSSPYDQGDWA